MISNKIAILGLVIVVNVAVEGAMMHKHNPKKPDKLAHQPGCYIEEENLVLPFGANLTLTSDENCFGVTCDEKYTYYLTCITVSAGGPECYVTEKDLSKAYPECCPSIACDSNDI